MKITGSPGLTSCSKLARIRSAAKAPAIPTVSPKSAKLMPSRSTWPNTRPRLAPPQPISSGATAQPVRIER